MESGGWLNQTRFAGFLRKGVGFQPMPELTPQ